MSLIQVLFELGPQPHTALQMGGLLDNQVAGIFVALNQIAPLGGHRHIQPT